jgi:hypothetical protein
MKAYWGTGGTAQLGKPRVTKNEIKIPGPEDQVKVLQTFHLIWRPYAYMILMIGLIYVQFSCDICRKCIK